MEWNTDRTGKKNRRQSKEQETKTGSGARQSKVWLILTGFPGFLGNFECYFESCHKVTEPTAGRD